jgi:putative two-component system response regulator
MSEKTILIVDDVPDNISILGGILRDHYKIKPAPSGEVAMKIVTTQPPDLVLLDIMMPGKDGYEVLKEMKSNDATRDIPVVFVSAKSEQVDEDKGMELGAEGYLAKPVDPDLVLTMVKDILGS